MDIRKFTPCVLQDIGSLGQLPCSHSSFWANHSKQGIRHCWPCAILGWLVTFIMKLQWSTIIVHMHLKYTRVKGVQLAVSNGFPFIFSFHSANWSCSFGSSISAMASIFHADNGKQISKAFKWPNFRLSILELDRPKVLSGKLDKRVSSKRQKCVCSRKRDNSTSNGGCRRKEKSRKHWSFFTKFFFWSLQIFFLLDQIKSNCMYWLHWKSEKNRIEPNVLDELRCSKSLNQTTSYAH